MQKTINNILFSQFISIIYYAAKTAVQKNPSDYNKNNYYVFLVNKSEKSEKNGIMPFNRHFGFMFMENNSGPLSEAEVQHTIAHELGHGAFTLYHTFSTKDKGITQGNTFNLMDYPPAGGQVTTKQPNNLLRKYQWYIIHNPRLSLFGGDEEEVSSTAYLEPDFDLQNYYGHAKILSYLLDEGVERMLEEIDIYRPTKENPFGAKQIIEAALGYGTIVGDEKEAILLLDEFHHLYTWKKILEKYEEFSNQSQSIDNVVFSKEKLYYSVKSYMGYSESILQSCGILVESLSKQWELMKGLNSSELNYFKDALLNSLPLSKPEIEMTTSGMKNILKNVSNQKIKKLYKMKLPNTTKRVIKNVIWSRNTGVHNYDDLVKVLKPNDFIDIINTIDDYTLETIRNTTNFTILKENPLLKITQVTEVVGNVINLGVLIYSMKHDLKISPLDILAVFPHPISIAVLIAQPVMEDYEKKMTEIVREGETYQTVKCWNTTKDNGEPLYCSLKGKHQNKDEWLYICYTNQNTKYNPDVLPTSIILSDKSFANRILGFEPTICDFGYKSRIGKENSDYNFHPDRQVKIIW